MEGKIRTILILEILGRPKEHLVKNFEEIIEKLGNEEGVKIIEKTVHEPKKIEDPEDEFAKKGEIFTSFSEIEVEFNDLNDLIRVIFNYMPSNIEIVSPEKLNLSNVTLSELLTGIILRLHKYDEIAKRVLFEREEMIKKLREIQGDKNESKESN